MSHLKVPVSERDHSAGGGTDAPLTLVEYGDYECSYCGKAYPLVKAAQSTLGNDLRFVFRNFPLSNLHPDAEDAAEAAEVAAGNDKFWEMNDLLYENQGSLDEESLIKYAAIVGLDTDAFVNDLTGHTYLEKVREDFLGGVKSGVNGTPTFFINGTRFDGDWNHNGLITALIEELEKLKQG